METLADFNGDFLTLTVRDEDGIMRGMVEIDVTAEMQNCKIGAMVDFEQPPQIWSFWARNEKIYETSVKTEIEIAIDLVIGKLYHMWNPEDYPNNPEI